MSDFDKTTLRIDRFELLQRLPEIPDRESIIKTAINIQYGDIIPEPEFFELKLINRAKKFFWYQITSGKKSAPIAFNMLVIKPDGDGPFPAVVCGDLCFDYLYDKDFYGTFTQNGIMPVFFNRLDIAHDTLEDSFDADIYRAYSEYEFGAIMAWAWGFSRCVDALYKLPFADLSCIAFSGHSRGGKVALVAGALDSRAHIVNPNGSGTGGAGCYRSRFSAYTESGELKRNEQLSDLIKNFPYWFSKRLVPFVERECELPFDQHFIKALVSPRVLLTTEAISDIWADTLGTYTTNIAAREYYKTLGIEKNLLWHYRRGGHFYHKEDISALTQVILNFKNGTPLPDDFLDLPFDIKSV